MGKKAEELVWYVKTGCDGKVHEVIADTVYGRRGAAKFERNGSVVAAFSRVEWLLRADASEKTSQSLGKMPPSQGFCLND